MALPSQVTSKTHEVVQNVTLHPLESPPRKESPVDKNLSGLKIMAKSGKHMVKKSA